VANDSATPWISVTRVSALRGRKPGSAKARRGSYIGLNLARANPGGIIPGKERTLAVQIFGVA
jgi:hypothetical protein